MNIPNVHAALLAALVAECAGEGRPGFAVEQVAWGTSGGVCPDRGEDCDDEGSLSVIVPPSNPLFTDGGEVNPQLVRSKVTTVVEVLRPYPTLGGELEIRLAYGDAVTDATNELTRDLEVIWHFLTIDQRTPSWLVPPGEPPGLGVVVRPAIPLLPAGGTAGFQIPVVWAIRTLDPITP